MKSNFDVRKRTYSIRSTYKVRVTTQYWKKIFVNMEPRCDGAPVFFSDLLSVADVLDFNIFVISKNLLKNSPTEYSVNPLAIRLNLWRIFGLKNVLKCTVYDLALFVFV